MNQLETAAYKLLSTRQRINSKTDITQFTRYIQQTIPATTEQDVITFFKGLQDQGVGVVVRGRKDNPNRFIWSYNLKEVAERALGLRTEVSKLGESTIKAKPVKAKRGRPVGSKTKVKRSFKIVKPKNAMQAGPAILIQLPVSFTQADAQALVELVKEYKVK